jgi:hypothetical protein
MAYAKTLSNRQIISALGQSLGVVGFAARLLGVSRQTLQRRIEANPALPEAIEDGKANARDMAWAQIYTRLQEGDGPTLRWYLDHYGVERGHGSRRPETRVLDADELEALAVQLAQLEPEDRIRALDRWLHLVEAK